MSIPLELPAPARRRFDRLAADLSRVFGARFVALVAYGPASSVAFATTLSADDLEACAALAEAWHHDGFVTPLLLTPDEFSRSVDAFPLEYQAIIDRHVLIAGRDPFQGVAINRDDLRRACEVQARSHLLHLRQGWVDSGGHERPLAELMARSAAPLRALLMSVGGLHGVRAADFEAYLQFAERTIGLPRALLHAIVGLDEVPESAPGLTHRMREYLSVSERLWAYVDAWRAE